MHGLPEPPHQSVGLTIFPVLEGRRELFGSDPGDPSFLLGFLRCCEGRLSLGPRVGGPGEKSSSEGRQEAKVQPWLGPVSTLSSRWRWRIGDLVSPLTSGSRVHSSTQQTSLVPTNQAVEHTGNVSVLTGIKHPLHVHEETKPDKVTPRMYQHTWPPASSCCRSYRMPSCYSPTTSQTPGAGGG